MTMVLYFAVFLLAFAGIGIASAKASRGTKKDYYLASSAVPPWLVGLSAVATNNSGYMFIGVIGFTYAVGLDSVWLMIGWIAGDALASTLVHRRLRLAASRTGEPSYAGVLANWMGPRQRRVQQLVGLLSLVFLIAYASAQLTAGSKALQVMFDWPAWAGVCMGAGLIAAYCLAGGIRASIWTDAAQSLVMLVAMATLCSFAVVGLGGIEPTLQQLSAIPQFMDWQPESLPLSGMAGMGLFVLAWLFAGVSVIGQPHIMVRFMALDQAGNMLRARAWYYLWFVAFYSLALAVGLLSRLYIANSADFDAELALPQLALELLNPLGVGLVLAGIFAATMSTADSLVLSCSAAISHDLRRQPFQAVIALKLVTLAIIVMALLLALWGQASVFELVILAWSGLASAFAPLLIARCLSWPVTQLHAIVAILGGLAVAMGWRFMGWHGALYEGLPGIVLPLVYLYAAGPLRQALGQSVASGEASVQK